MKGVDNHKIRKWVTVAKVAFLVLILVFVVLSIIYGNQSLAANEEGTSILSFADDIYGIVSGLVGLLAVIMVIASGIVYATSEGDSNKIKTAKEMIVAALMGVILYAFASWLLGPNGINKYFPKVTVEMLPGVEYNGQNTSNTVPSPGSQSGSNGEGNSGSGGGGGGGDGW